MEVNNCGDRYNESAVTLPLATVFRRLTNRFHNNLVSIRYLSLMSDGVMIITSLF
jgi:hypothetical protein